jgi:hypothetical protein
VPNIGAGDADVNYLGWLSATAGNSGKALRRGKIKRQVDQPAVLSVSQFLLLLI